MKNEISLMEGAARTIMVVRLLSHYNICNFLCKYYRLDFDEVVSLIYSNRYYDSLRLENYFRVKQ